MTLEELKKEIRPLDETSMELDKDRKTTVFSGKAGGCSDTDGGDQRDPGL